jgi:hypothetical protein
MADDDPPRQFYQLKPREFEAVNCPVPQTPPVARGEPHQASGKIDIRDLYEQAKTPGPLLATARAAARRNDIHVILEDNLSRANAAGLNTLSPKPKRRSRRTRDYFLVMIPLTAFFAYAAFGPYSNVMLMAYGVAGIILSTLGLGWIMFGVMDDY